MWGTRKDPGQVTTGRPRFRAAGVVVGLLLVISQSIGIIAASASGDPRERTGAFSSTTSVSKGSSPKGSAPAPKAGNGTTAPVVLATQPIVSNQIDAFEGQIAGTTNWTPGNLCQSNGPCYHELDNVPHRIIFKNLSPGTEYSVTVLIDFKDNAGHRGYDNVNGVTGFSGTPDPTVTYNGTTTSGCGQSTTCKSYTFTFTPTAAGPEVRFNAHLAIGAHLFGGSSLSARILGSTKNVPLPVRNILLDITAHKFNDLNGNGTQDNGEPNLSGWTMTLYAGTACSGSPVNVSGNAGTDPNPGVTDANGDVQWTNLSASDGDNSGSFSVRETLQPGWQNTTALCQAVGIVANMNVANFGNQQLAPELTITKSASSGSVQFGSSFSYTITVKNAGNAPATGVVISDDLADSLTSVSASYDIDPGSGADGSCSVGAGNVVTCNVGTLAASDGKANGPDEVKITIDAIAPGSCGTITNTAHVGWSGSELGADSNEVSVDVTGCAPSLKITKTAPSPSVQYGGAFTFLVTVRNQGNAEATGVVVTDDLADSLTGVSATYDVNPGAPGGTGACTVDPGNIVTCTVGTLAPDDGAPNGLDTVRVTIQATAPSACGTITNTAHVSSDQDVEGADSNEVSVDVTGCAPDLTITKSASTGSVGPGDSFTWRVTVVNGGNAAADDVVVTDDLPDSLTGVSASYDIDPGSGSDGDCSVGAGNVVTCNVGTLAASDGQANGDDTVQVTIDVTAPDSCGPLDNTAQVQIGTQPATESNTSTVNVEGCTPGLEFSKSGPTSVGQGGTVEYHISVSNTGNAASDPLTVTDDVPSALTNVQASFQFSGDEGSQDCSVEGNSVTCELGSLQPGDSVDITITATAPSNNTCPTLQNTAYVWVVGAEAGEPTNTVTTAVTGCTTPPPPPPPIGIQIVKGGPALAHVGDTITYTFDVSLTTSTPLSDVSVSDPICSAAPTLDSKDGGDQDAVLEPGETWHYSCTHVVSSSDPDPLPNTATVTGKSAHGRTATDQDSHLVDIIHPAIKIVKTADPTSGGPGDTITYTYVVTNTGDVTLYDVTVDDDVIGHICDIGTLDPGQSKTCTARYVIPDQTGPIDNIGTAVGADETGTKVSDEDKASVGIVLGTVVTPPPTKTPPQGTAFTGAPGNTVPLAALALILLLIGSGALFLSRRKEGRSGA